MSSSATTDGRSGWDSGIEHPSLRATLRRHRTINEINNSCLAAYNSGDEETVTLLQASKGDY